MKIKKLGHCCMVIEKDGARIMTDPGLFSRDFELEEGIDALLITHEHADHFHIESIKKILEKNPEMKIYTNKAVGALMDEAGIAYELISDGEMKEIAGLAVESFECDHALIHETLPAPLNSGFLVDNRLFFPGDAFVKPGNKPVEILALPVAAPWMKISEAIDYCLDLKPKYAFPVHDGILLRPLGGTHKAPGMIFEKHDIAWHVPEHGEVMEF